MTVITVYSKPDCHLCTLAVATLRKLQTELAFALQERDITTDEGLHRAYFERIPVIALEGEELCDYFVDEALLRERLGSAVRPNAASDVPVRRGARRGIL
jgi:glutaredoxin